MKIAIRLSLVLGLAVLAVPAAGQTLYGAVGSSNATSNLFTLNPSTGALVTTIGPIGFAITGMAFHPQTGVLYASTSRNSGASPHSLITIDTTTGAGTLIGSYQQGTESLADITFASDGTLYGWLEPNTDELCTVNLATGVATTVGPSGLSTFGSGIAANAANTIYYAGEGNDGSLYSVSRFTGFPTAVATLNGGGGPGGSAISALAFNNTGVLYGVVFQGFGGSPATNLVTIEPGSGVITTLGPSVNGLDAIAFSGTFVTIPTLDKKALALFAVLLAAAAILVLRAFRAS